MTMSSKKTQPLAIVMTTWKTIKMDKQIAMTLTANNKKTVWMMIKMDTAMRRIAIRSIPT